MAKALLRSIKDINKETFIVKTYQRGYRWEKTEIEELMTDLVKFRDDNGNNIYCLQPIVVKKTDGDRYELVDGQQRLTALWLFAKYHQLLFHQLGETYTLLYEGKDDFTQLLNDIAKHCNIAGNTPEGLLTLVDQHRNDSIDAYMLAESVHVMYDFKMSDTKLIPSVLTDILSKVQYIGVIWYELDDTEDSIQFFTDLNANKVPLTDAELIKATLYHAADPEKKDIIISEWQEIEKKLYDEELWHFVTYDVNKAVRIEYLFEVWCCQQGLPIVPQEKNPVFHAINDQLALGIISATELWNKIKEVFEALVDWKTDYKMYHIIGFLTLVYSSKEKNVSLIKELYEYYGSHKKSEFEKELKRRVNELFIGKTLLASKVNANDILGGINDLRYGAHNKMIIRVLQFYNIALLLEENNPYERFPFKALKMYAYDIEHVNPQTPDFDTSERKEWLEDHKTYSKLSPGLVLEIDNCLKVNMSAFDAVAEKIRTELGLDEHAIGNLVLLDSKTNRGYKNACFVKKRKAIVNKLRSVSMSNSNEKTPVLPGTKWVFLKEYNDVDTNKIWNQDDVTTYTNDIGNKLYEFLK